MLFEIDSHLRLHHPQATSDDALVIDLLDHEANKYFELSRYKAKNEFPSYPILSSNSLKSSWHSIETVSHVYI